MNNTIKDFTVEGNYEFEKQFGEVWKIIEEKGVSGCPVMERKNRQIREFYENRQELLIKMIVEMVESEKKEDPIKNGMDRGYNPRAYDRERKEAIIYNKGNNQALDTISSKLKEVI